MTSIFDRDAVNAFCRHTHVALPPTANGLLDGLTFGLKDIYDIAGHRTGFGNPDWLTSHEPATHSSSVLTRLLHAGAELVGRTHTEEMAFSLTGENAHYGTPTNFAAPNRVPGGSSSGSAAAVAASLVDFAIGSDTGGSVRGPASFCGIYGIRTTHGRIALDGTCALAPSFDTCGWFARRASVMSLVGSVLFNGRPQSHQTSSPGELLISHDAFAYIDAEVAAALQPGVRRVQSLLGSARSIEVSREGFGAWYDVFRVLQYDEIWKAHGEWITRTHPTFGPQMITRFEAVKANDQTQVAPMKVVRADIAERLNKLLADNAVLLMPTISGVAPLRGASPKDTVTFRERALALLCVAGLGGLPQLNLPFNTLDELPIGLSIVAARGNDEMLLAIAEELEQIGA
ncbi:MAG: amidase [Gemmatimonadaceae bacterium]